MRIHRNKKILWLAVAAALVVGALIWFYSSYLSKTRIVFVNEQPITVQTYAAANNNKRIKLYNVGTDKLNTLRRYDIVLINGMGLHITAEQRQMLQKLAAKGKPMLTSMATNPDNNISTLLPQESAVVARYMAVPSVRNCRSLLNYLRRHVDGKISSTGTIAPPEEQPGDYLYYPAEDDGEDMNLFTSVQEYETFLSQRGLLPAEGDKIVVTGAIADLSDLVRALSQRGYRVYPVSSIFHLVDYLEEIQPAAVINLAHGRVGEHLVAYLKEKNILLFCPVYVNALQEDWEQDPMGMSGGFMSQSIVMPELDGAIRTYALFALQRNKDGLLYTCAIPDRLESFMQTVDKYLRLRHTPNAQKRVAIVYYKGPGQGSLTAGGLDVVPSLYRLLKELERQGYRTEGLPTTVTDFARQLQQEGSLYHAFAAGDIDRYLRTGHPQIVTAKEYEEWCQRALPQTLIQNVEETFGAFPGEACPMRTAQGHLAIPHLQYGNITLLPQPLPGVGNDEFHLIHGTEAAPPHDYIASYLWLQHGLQADALIHFGTHGSLEFTPQKQTALCSYDWPDRLVGTLPHFYLYTIDNVGEAMTARRRSYADLVSHLTPPFHDSQLRQQFRRLDSMLARYSESDTEDEKLNLSIKRMATQLGLGTDLGLDSNLSRPYAPEELERLSNYEEELAAEKITDVPYTLGTPYGEKEIYSSVQAMTVDPIAYSLYTVDRLCGRAPEHMEENRKWFHKHYIVPAEQLVRSCYQAPISDARLCSLLHLSPQEVAQARQQVQEQNRPKGMQAVMAAMAKKTKGEAMNGMQAMGAATDTVALPPAHNSPMAKWMRHYARKHMTDEGANGMLAMAKRMGADEESLKKMAAALSAPTKDTTKAHRAESTDSAAMPMELARAICEVETALFHVQHYLRLLQESPALELQSLMNALGGGYTPPSPGGDIIVNPNTLPTGRNLFSINAEETPTEAAWRQGVALAENTLKEYYSLHGEYPRKVAYTLWSGEFIQTGGATIAQALYLLGVEPVRDRYGRVNDLRLIPSEQLGRPRIDVVVQTSGQLRDLAASRLFLLQRAVHMAAEAHDTEYPNQVKAGVEESERVLIEKGIAPREARRLSHYRIFGGQNGNYGTGIQSMVERGDAWDSEHQIAETYLSNMGAFYGSAEEWMGNMQEAFSAALSRTDMVVQPRQNNTWGALSLDHVYEFMGGMNLAVREVTGHEPEAYFSDYRNRNHYRIQSGRQAITTEARTKLLNPAYIQNAFAGGTTPTDAIAEMARNLYGWNVMKPEAVGNDLWNQLYSTYIEDQHHLGTLEHFAAVNPAALMEMTATMLETARKGYWQASPEQLSTLAQTHADFVKRFGPSGSSFEGSNHKLQQFIAQNAPQQAADYEQALQRQRTAGPAQERQAQVLQQQHHSAPTAEGSRTSATGYVAAIVVLLLFATAILLLRRRNKH